MDCNIITNRNSIGKIWNMLFYAINAFLLLQLDNTCVCFLCRPNWQDFYRYSRGSEEKIGKSTGCSVQAPLLCFLCEVFHAVDTLSISAKNQIEPINSFQRDKPQFPEFITNIL